MSLTGPRDRGTGEGVKRWYEFGPFRLAPEEGQLRRGAEEVPLAQKSFKVLLLLLENGGRVVDKAELMEKVWPDTFVDENRLADNISTLRKALGDDPKSPRYIKTVTGRGYRFIADVREMLEDVPAVFERTRAKIVFEENQETPPSDPHAPKATPAAPPAPTAVGLLPGRVRRRGRTTRAAVLVVAGLLVATLGAYFYARERGGGRGPLARTIAVLPFKPLVPDSRDPALEMGMTDALISKLSSIRQLTVRPTSSVMKYAAEGLDLRAAGSELGVEVLLDGKVQKDGDRVRLSVQLVRAADGATVWAEKFDEKFTDIFAVQDAVSERAAKALELELTGEERKGLSKRYTDNVEAYQLYMQGHQHWSTFTYRGREKSINYFNEALRLDPDYALAYTGLANTYIVMGIYGPPTPADVIPKAREAIRRALELDEELAQAHVSYGAFKICYERDWPGAEKELKRAMELSPTNADAPDLYGYYLTAMGRAEEAVASHRRAKELAPLWPIPARDLLDALFFAKRYDEAMEQSRQMLRLDPNESYAVWVLAKVLNMKGLHDEAAAEIRPRLDSPEVGEHMKGRLLAELGYAYAATGRRDEAAGVIQQLKAKPDPFRPVQLAKIYAGAGDREQALAWLTKAADDLFPFLYEVKAEAHFDGLRGDPRYAALMRRINLEP